MHGLVMQIGGVYAVHTSRVALHVIETVGAAWVSDALMICCCCMDSLLKRALLEILE